MFKVYPFEKTIRFTWLVSLLINYIFFIKPYFFSLDSNLDYSTIFSIIFPTISVCLLYYCVYHKFGTGLIGFIIIFSTLGYAYLFWGSIGHTLPLTTKFDLLRSLALYCLDIAVYIVNRKVQQRYLRSSELYKKLIEEWKTLQNRQELQHRYEDEQRKTPESTLIIKLAYKDTKMLVN